MGIQDLINVQFQDATNHVTVNGDDMLAVVFNHYWGPVNELKELGASDFFGYYPESLPLGVNTIDVAKYFSLAQIKQAFACRMPKVQSYRPKCGWKYQQVNVTASAATLVSGGSATKFSDTVTDLVSIASKYPGFFPQSLAPGSKYIKLVVSATASSVVSVKIYGSQNNSTSSLTGDVLLESFEGNCTPGATQDGMPYYLPNVLEKSQFVDAQVNGAFSDLLEDVVVVFDNYTATTDVFTTETSGAHGVEDVVSAITTIFGDIEQNNGTLMINPYADQKGAVTTAILNAAAAAKTFNPIIGVPTSTTWTKSNIESARDGAGNNMFGLFVAGREMLTIFGMKILSNCVGGFAGCTAAVAKDVRLNQMASAKMYGAYPGTLVDSCNFNEVLSMHDERGIISVYNTKNGPYIFGVRSMYANQDSYFGKANVMRVTANVLKNIFPVVLTGVHTDVASEKTSMLSMQTKLNNVLAPYIANKNLKQETRAICDESINTDQTTSGGKYLNTILDMWYIGLAERIRILVRATDSSVSAEIV